MIGLSPFRWRNERKGGLLAVAVALAAAIFLPGCSPAEPSEQRRIIATEWDTLMQLGTDHPADTLFAYPIRVLLWGDGFAVADRYRLHIRMFDAEGNLKWTAGREGGGPREFKNLLDLQVAPNDNLWALDANNARISEIDAGGEFVRQIPLTHLPIQGTQFLVLDDRVVLAANSPVHTLIEVSLDDARILGTRPIRWADPIDESLNLSLALGRHPTNGSWAAAMRLGPGFNLFGGDSVGSHAFIEHIPFVLKANPRLTEAGGDSARNAAMAVHGTEDAYLMLFGGRPRRRAHPREPTHFIDQYDLEGNYVQSFRLPMDARAFTSDGESFFVIQHDPYPSILKLRPRVQEKVAVGQG